MAIHFGAPCVLNHYEIALKHFVFHFFFVLLLLFLRPEFNLWRGPIYPDRDVARIIRLMNARGRARQTD